MKRNVFYKFPQKMFLYSMIKKREKKIYPTEDKLNPLAKNVGGDIS